MKYTEHTESQNTRKGNYESWRRGDNYGIRQDCASAGHFETAITVMKVFGITRRECDYGFQRNDVGFSDSEARPRLISTSYLLLVPFLLWLTWGQDDTKTVATAPARWFASSAISRPVAPIAWALVPATTAPNAVRTRIRA